MPPRLQYSCTRQASRVLAVLSSPLLTEERESAQLSGARPLAPERAEHSVSACRACAGRRRHSHTRTIAQAPTSHTVLVRNK